MKSNHLSLVDKPSYKTLGFSTFMETLYSPEEIEHINAKIGKLCKIVDYQGKTLPKRVHIKGSVEKGTIHPFRVAKGKASNDFIIATSVEFPEWLAKETSLNNIEAQRLAGVYVNSFALIYSSMVRYPGRGRRLHAGGEPLDQQLWDGLSPAVSTPYRAAACVALGVCGLEPLTHPDIPQPAHVAGLIQPLMPSEFKNFHAILK